MWVCPLIDFFLRKLKQLIGHFLPRFIIGLFEPSFIDDFIYLIRYEVFNIPNFNFDSQKTQNAKRHITFAKIDCHREQRN